MSSAGANWILAALRGEGEDGDGRFPSSRPRHADNRPRRIARRDPDRASFLRLKGGDHAALAELYDRHYAALHRFVVSVLHSPDDASEIVTDLFVHLWERRSDVHIQTTFVAYLFGAARNRARNRLRDEQTRRRIETQLHVVDALPLGTRERAADDRVEQDDLAAYALRVLDSLPDPGRTAATLRWMNDLSYQEIGQILEISPGAAQVHVSRVLKVLRTLLPGLTD